MFVWELWKEVCASSLEMAAQTTLSAFSPYAASADAPLTSRVEGFDVLALEHELFTTLGEQTFCIMDAGGQALAFCSNWGELTGLQPEQCLGEHFTDFFHPQHRQLLFRKIAEFRGTEEEKGGANAKQYRFRGQYGSTHVGYRWYEYTLSRRMAVEGRDVLVLMMRSISREMETERMLRTAQIESELALRARTEFLGHMSHELRTPLNAILGFSEMMEQGVHGEVKNEHYRDYLRNIRESGHMLLNRINDMLEIASIEVGDTEIHEELVAPADLLDVAMKLHHHEAFCRRVMLVAKGVLPKVLVRCDPAKISRVLGNIIANAIGHSGAGREVSLACEWEGQGALAFVVSDCGAGIAVDHLALLQEALDKRSGMFATNPETVCLGLGLIVAREFVGLHGGRLEIDSVKGKGTEVRLILPAARVASLEPPRARLRRQLAEHGHA